MAQFIDIAYKSSLSSAIVNDKIFDVLGKNGITKGFNVVPGTGLTVDLNMSPDTESILFINGVRIKETANITGISIEPNSSGVTRTDTIYAYYEHGVSGDCIYLVASGTTQSPTPSLSCKIAEVDVPDGATSILVGNIRMEPKIYSLDRLSKKASETLDGLMSKEDFAKLKNIEAEANKYIHPTTSGYKHIPAGGTTGKILGWSADGTAIWIDPPETYTHPTNPGNKHIPAGGVSGKILGWAGDGEAAWIDAPVTYTHPTTSGYKHIPSGGSAGKFLKWSADGTATWATPSYYVHPTSNGYKHIPVNGAAGQYLKYSAPGTAVWGSLRGDVDLAMTQTSTTATLKNGVLLKKTASNGVTYTIVDNNAKVWRAIYNDLAELMLKGEDNLTPGDVLVQGENGLVRTSNPMDGKVIGVYSDTFGFCLGGEELNSIEDNKDMVPVGISGQVLVKVKGVVEIGDLLVTCETPGYARALDKNNYVPGTVFAKAKESYNESIDGDKRIWALIMNA